MRDAPASVGLLMSVSNMDTIKFADGSTYRTHDALTSSAGSIGVANIRVMLDEFKDRVDAWSQIAIHDESRGKPVGRWHGEKWVLEHRLPTEDCLLITDVFGSETIYLRYGSALDGVIDALDDYPVIDDTVVAEVEAEWEKDHRSGCSTT